MSEHFQVSQENGYPVLKILGELDFADEQAFDAALRQLHVGDAAAVIISFEECSFFDSSAVHVLMRYWKLPARSWNAILVLRPDSSAKRVLEIVGVDKVYPMAWSMEEALRLAPTLALSGSSPGRPPG